MQNSKRNRLIWTLHLGQSGRYKALPSGFSHNVIFKRGVVISRIIRMEHRLLLPSILK
ncbi:hypothetical protein D3C78_1046200 [compost metagenome]